MDFSEPYPDTSSAVSIAARRGDLTMLRAMKEANRSCSGRDSRGWYAIHEAAYWSKSECLSLLLQWDGVDANCTTFEGETPLWLAIKNEDMGIVTILVNAGASVHLPNNENVTPLHVAASKGNINIARVLLSRGANPNVPDFNQMTSLHEAVLVGNKELASLLLEQGGNPNITDCHGRTALFCAAEKHSCEIVSLMLPLMSERKSKAKSEDDATCLMLAAQAGCKNCVDLFLRKGDDVNAATVDGFMAVHFALCSDNTELFCDLLSLTDVEKLKNSDAIANIVELGIQEEKYDQLKAMRRFGIDFKDFWIDYHRDDYKIPPLSYFLHTDGAVSQRGVDFFDSCEPSDYQPPVTILRSLIRNWNRFSDALRLSYLRRLIETSGRSLCLMTCSEDLNAAFSPRNAPSEFWMKLLQNGVHLEPDFEFCARSISLETHFVRSLKDSCRFVVRRHFCNIQRWNSLVTAIEELPLPVVLKSYLNFRDYSTVVFLYFLSKLRLTAWQVI